MLYIDGITKPKVCLRSLPLGDWQPQPIACLRHTARRLAAAAHSSPTSYHLETRGRSVELIYVVPLRDWWPQPIAHLHRTAQRLAAAAYSLPTPYRSENGVRNMELTYVVPLGDWRPQRWVHLRRIAPWVIFFRYWNDERGGYETTSHWLTA